ncbi:hypothetical protein DPMN_140582 [Dreissena polymorpha]|uniref:Mab-21-like HhH/H2TH-like domain-containing protein n=1 Tax=Dreissena polymorpha TaxID=45954 RepID=A0A9D4GB69_DREPO|nr:hypothetical protein DPMN_140582 [Dreissena polymorpha]
MKWLGYGPEIRQARRDAYREEYKLMTALMMMDGMTSITVGSKGEGLTSIYESDKNIFFVHNDIICLEDGITVCNFPKEMTVFRSCSRMRYSGYTRLLLEILRSDSYSPAHEFVCEVVCFALRDDGFGRKLLSSGKYFNKLSILQPSTNTVLHDRDGPSLSYSVGALNIDKIYPLRYYCPSIMQKWAARPRQWPPTNVVQKVVSLGAYLTPVGFKGSEYQDVEWRVCFDTGEIELVCNLNATQVNLYVLLKMVTNDVLKPRRKEVTSFTIKNIVLWMAEKNSQTLFHETSLIKWLHEGLNALKAAIVTKELPYFMIPERNLMAESDLKYEQQCRWILTLTEMLNEGPRMILRLPKIRRSIVAHPEPFRWYSKMRMELEMVGLRYETRRTLCTYHRPDEKWVVNYSDVILQELQIRTDEIVIEVFLRMIMEGSQATTSQDVLESMLKN